MNTPLRTLPISLDPLDGETPDGFLARLAQAHLLDEVDLRRVILQRIGRSWWPAVDSHIVEVLEELADLPIGSLLPDFERDGMWVRCGHHSWSPEKCAKCLRFAQPRTACRTCAGGRRTTTIARGAALCLIHGEWTFRELHADVAGISAYEHAELTLRARLWKRGVALHTGEVNLAAAFVRAWHAGAGASNPISDRLSVFAVDALDTYERVLLCAYPEVVRIACTLVSTAVITPVLDIRMSALDRAGVLSRAVADAIGEPENDELRTFTIRVVGHAHRAMLYMYGLRSTRQAKHQLSPLNRALIVAASRQRACLLRHASPRRIPDIAGKVTGAAPKPRVIRKWPIKIDELALS